MIKADVSPTEKKSLNHLQNEENFFFLTYARISIYRKYMILLYILNLGNRNLDRNSIHTKKKEDTGASLIAALNMCWEGKWEGVGVPYTVCEFQCSELRTDVEVRT